MKFVFLCYDYLTWQKRKFHPHCECIRITFLLRMNNIPLHACATFASFTHLCMDIWVVPKYVLSLLHSSCYFSLRWQILNTHCFYQTWTLNRFPNLLCQQSSISSTQNLRDLLVVTAPMSSQWANPLSSASSAMSHCPHLWAHPYTSCTCITAEDSNGSFWPCLCPIEPFLNTVFRVTMLKP